MANDFDHLIFTREHCSQVFELTAHAVGIQLLLMIAALVLIALPSVIFSGGFSERAEGPRGGYSRSMSSSCAGGSCSRSYHTTGPNGGQSSSAQNITRTSSGQVSSSHTATGPDGKNASRGQSTACADGSCTHTATAAGPNGQSASSSNTVTQNGPGRYSSSGTETSPQGTYSTNAATNCSNGGCVHGATVAGPSGGPVRHASRRRHRCSWRSDHSTKACLLPTTSSGGSCAATPHIYSACRRSYSRTACTCSSGYRARSGGSRSPATRRRRNRRTACLGNRLLARCDMGNAPLALIINIARYRARLVLIFVFMAASGCMNVGPDFQKPAVALQDKWSAVGTPGLSGKDLNFKEFWSGFNDPILEHVLEIAQTNNPSLQSAAEAITQAQASLRMDVGASLPAIQLTGGTVYTQPDLASGLQGENGHSISDQALGQLSWEVDFWGKWRRATEADRAALNSSQAALASARVSLQASVASTYINVRVLQNRIRVAESTLREQEENLRIAKARYRYGATSELDWRQAHTLCEQTRSQLPALRSSLAQYAHSLSVAMGSPPDSFLRTYPQVGDLPTIGLSALSGAPRDLLRRRPDVLQAQMNAAAQSARIGQAQAALYPSFSLSGDVGYSGTNGANNLFTWDNRALTYGASFVLPIFDRGRLKAQVDVQSSLFRQAILAYQNQVLKAQQEVEDAISSLTSSTEQLVSLRAADASAARTATLAMLQYRSGQSEYTTVISAEQAHLQTSDALVQTLGTQLLAQVETFRAMGGGWHSTTASNQAALTP